MKVRGCVRISKGEQTKQYIIEQSALLLNKQGYMSTSLSEIMAVTGMKKGTLYNHFKDKERIGIIGVLVIV